MDDSYAHYSEQAMLVGAAGAILRDDKGAILLLKPTYKAVWQLPGGLMDVDESPRAAAAREIREEIGLEIAVGRLISVDYKSAGAARTSGVQFLFDGGTLTDEQLGQLKPDASEIEDWRLAPPAEAVALVEAGRPAARLDNTLTALAGRHTVYLEDGRQR